MDLDFKQAIFCYALTHSVIITLAPLTNQCLQAAIDAAALLQKKKEEEAAAALLQKKKEEEVVNNPLSYPFNQINSLA